MAGTTIPSGESAPSRVVARWAVVDLSKRRWPPNDGLGVAGLDTPLHRLVLIPTRADMQMTGIPMTTPFPAELRFPKPPFRMDRSLAESQLPDAAAEGYLNDIRAWRLAVLEFVARPGTGPQSDPDGLSERARKALVTFLAESWSEATSLWAAQSPYNVSAFPISGLEADKMSTVDSILKILRWRAGLEDCLSDIWDVIGEPALDLDECDAIGQFLRPASEAKLCCLCLNEYAPGDLPPDRHGCLILGMCGQSGRQSRRLLSGGAPQVKQAPSAQMFPGDGATKQCPRHAPASLHRFPRIAAS